MTALALPFTAPRTGFRRAAIGRSRGTTTRRGGRATESPRDPRWCGPVVTLTAMTGTPAAALSTAVAAALGLPCYDDVFPALVAAATGATLADATDMDEVVPSRLAVAMAWSACHPGAPELDGALAAVRVLERFPEATRDVIHAVAADPAGGVIVGRHAAFVLAGHERAAHVLLDAPLRWRQAALQAEFGWSASDAHDHLRARDRARRRAVVRAHGVEVTDAGPYDVVLDASVADLPSMVAVVVAEAARQGAVAAYDRPR